LRFSPPVLPLLSAYGAGPFKEIAAWHIPQLQLEMLCLGDSHFVNIGKESFVKEFVDLPKQSHS
jgi:hypothetical protein